MYPATKLKLNWKLFKQYTKKIFLSISSTYTSTYTQMKLSFSLFSLFSSISCLIYVLFAETNFPNKHFFIPILCVCVCVCVRAYTNHITQLLQLCVKQKSSFDIKHKFKCVLVDFLRKSNCVYLYLIGEIYSMKIGYC